MFKPKLVSKGKKTANNVPYNKLRLEQHCLTRIAKLINTDDVNFMVILTIQLNCFPAADSMAELPDIWCVCVCVCVCARVCIGATNNVSYVTQQEQFY